LGKKFANVFSSKTNPTFHFDLAKEMPKQLKKKNKLFKVYTKNIQNEGSN
jgi:NAD-dependent SIR2 family protein deacetylase